MEIKKVLPSAEVLEKLPRISRAEFMENLYEILDVVTYEDAGFVITEEGQPDLLLCPAEWVGLDWDEDLSLALCAALKQVLSEDGGNADAVFNSIRKNMWRIDTDTLREMCGIVEAAGTGQVSQLHTKMMAELISRHDEMAQ